MIYWKKKIKKLMNITDPNINKFFHIKANKWNVFYKGDYKFNEYIFIYPNN